ncbi:hypothetical protein DB354_13335 [Opitutus sp. ER46]|nr:hypothetical protein DB354_13335 [Opitutus sp. ER46]
MVVKEHDFAPLFERCLNSVRADLRDSPYIIEGLKVLPVGGYRSAIGSFWNAVVDDLRNKIMARSLKLFNKSVKLSREIKSYEDFQNYVNDDDLIEGAYQIGVIGWEASKMLKHAKETRHIFSGHPKSSDPSVLKVLAMMDDCVKYVLNAEYPAPIIDIDDYLAILGGATFDRNAIAVENALGTLPEVYKTELINRLFTAYTHPGATTVLTSNIEFVAPVLWQVLPKEVKIQVVRRVDQEIPKGNVASTEQAFAFVNVVGAMAYLTPVARKYKIKPLVEKLAANMDQWTIENETVDALYPYASIIPQDLLSDYVSAIVHTYVGYVGHSPQFARRDFYANGAAITIPKMIQLFDNRAAEAFVECVKTSRILRDRIQHPSKLRRLRALGNIVLEKISANFVDKALLEALADEKDEAALFKLLPQVSI